VNKRRKKELDRLNTVVDWIKRFNESCNECHVPAKVLTAHIQVKDNISLLHAAILMHDHTSVEKLLQMGARPSAKSGLGSALVLAHNMADGSKENEKMEEIVRQLRKFTCGQMNELAAVPSDEVWNGCHRSHMPQLPDPQVSQSLARTAEHAQTLKSPGKKWSPEKGKKKSMAKWKHPSKKVNKAKWQDPIMGRSLRGQYVDPMKKVRMN
jgi:hypothetical protein